MTKVSAKVKKDMEWLAYGADEVIPEEEFAGKLAASERRGKALRVKLGLDPSAPDIHLGHTVVLRKLRQFQDLGHTAVLIVGDFTGMIGDPSGRTVTRRQLTKEEVKKNAETYVDQLMKILDPAKTEVVFNSSWLKKMTMEDTLRLTGAYTVARMLERDDFSLRYTTNQPISIREFMYPLLQGYDSVAIEADVELGGTDQKFNLLVGREIMRDYGKVPQVIITMPLLEGTDGVNKMSKSLGNYIGISDTAADIFGKTMSIPDDLIGRYFALVTEIEPAEVKAIEEGLKENRLHPGDTKRRLARTLVTMYHGGAAAEAAEETFNVKHKAGRGGAAELAKVAVPVEVPRASLKQGKIWIVDLLRLAGFAATNGEARRLIRQGAVKEDGNAITAEDAEITVKDGTIIQAGKRKVGRLTLR